MKLIPFAEQYPGEFLERNEGNFNVFFDKLTQFHIGTRNDIGDGTNSRRRISNRFKYAEELKDCSINEKGIASEDVIGEFNDMISGSLRHQDPMTAFNIIPAPLLDVAAGLAILNLYTPNACWDFISGKICLYEKKIARMLGQLVNWSDAEGYVVTGGKQALIYAIKSGMGRAQLDSPAEIGDLVVICSNLAHYSIEHACHFLGISPENCIRVATKASGEMDPSALEQTLRRVAAENKRVATVIAVGGGTVNLVPDPIVEIKRVIDRSVQQLGLDYTPHLHVDTVISWAWLAFAKTSDSFWKKDQDPTVVNKIVSVVAKLEGINLADSFAADFHKTGFCPYAAGVYVVRQADCLIGLNNNSMGLGDELSFGEAEPYRETLENSRPANGIAAIWIALRRMGLDGLRKFILYQLNVCERFKQVIRKNHADHFEVLNDHTMGWEIVIKPKFHQKLSWDELQNSTVEEKQAYSEACHLFLKEFWYGPIEDETQKSPILGFIKSYSRKGKYEQAFPAFLIHPTSLHYNESIIRDLLTCFVNKKVRFEQNHNEMVVDEASEYLTRFVPPK
jgi:glutamate/tyrosine decarboxylase-like PLP-dependent enzyme